MEKVWDRDAHVEIVTGVRAIYSDEEEKPCDSCGKGTTRVVDYIGSLFRECPNCALSGWRV